MKLKARICSVKRHTLGFISTSNKRFTRDEATKLARQGKIEGVEVRESANGSYLVAAQGLPSLYELDEYVVGDVSEIVKSKKTSRPTTAKQRRATATTRR